LIVNDYWRLALEEGCDFVHLGQGDLDTADITALRDVTSLGIMREIHRWGAHAMVITVWLQVRQRSTTSQVVQAATHL